jgi:hypothetical protein
MASIGIWLALKGFMGVGRVLSFSQSLIQTDFFWAGISGKKIQGALESFRNIQSICNPSRDYPNTHRGLRQRMRQRRFNV